MGTIGAGMDQTLPLPHMAAEVTHSTLPFPAKKQLRERNIRRLCLIHYS